MKTFLLLILVVSLFSCSTTRTLKTVKLYNGSYITKAIEDSTCTGFRKHNGILYRTKNRATAKLDLKETSIDITLLNDKNIDSVDVLFNCIDVGTKSKPSFSIVSKYTYAPTVILKNSTIKNVDVQNKVDISAEDFTNEVSEFKFSGQIKYSENKAFLQTFTIPFKLRGEERDEPSNVSTSFNAGIAYGYQWNLVKVQPIYNDNKKTMIGYDKRTKSFALAPFAGLTPVSLTTTNTLETIEKDKTVLGISFGGAAVLSFNQINVGLAFGFDYGLNDSKDWIYQGKPWTGIVLGLDLIK